MTDLVNQWYILYHSLIGQSEHTPSQQQEVASIWRALRSIQLKYITDLHPTKLSVLEGKLYLLGVRDVYPTALTVEEATLLLGDINRNTRMVDRPRYTYRPTV